MINNFDDHIKKQFGNYKPEVPSYIWENIVAQKEQKKPGGFLFFLRNNRFALVLLLLIGTGAGALLVQNIYKNNTKENSTTGEQSLTTTTNTKDQNNISTDTKEEIKEGTTTQEDKSTGNTAASSTAQNVNSNNDVSLVNSSSADHQTPTATSNEKAVVLPVATQQNKVHNKNTGTKTTHVILSKSTSNTAVEKKATQFASSTDVNTDAKNNNPVSIKNKTKRSAGKSAIAIQAPAPDATDAIQDVMADATTTAVNANEVPVENRYLDLNTKPAEKTFSFSVKNINLPHLNIPCPGGKNGNGNHYFEIYAAPDYAFRSFNDTANSTYLKKRKESTHVTSAFSFGLRYTKVFNNGISFRTGVNYSQVNEKFKFEQGHVVQINYIINEYGDTTGSYATTGTRYKTTHNRYRTIDIPLTVGYEIGNDRLRANFNAGLVVNAYSWQRGDVLDSAYQPVNITTGKSNSAYQFKTNVGLGVTGGVSVYYRLTGKMYFLAEPYFRYNFSAANKADITLKQKYTTLGLRLGLRIDF